MMHRLTVGALASLAAMFMMFGRTQSLSATAFRPVDTTPVTVPADEPAARPDTAPAGVWPTNAPARLLEVIYVYTHRAPVTRQAVRDAARRDAQSL